MKIRIVPATMLLFISMNLPAGGADPGPDPFDLRKAGSMSIWLDYHGKEMTVKAGMNKHGPFPAPDGQAFSFKAGDGLSIHLRITNLNRNAYSVKVGESMQKEREMELPPIFAQFFAIPAGQPRTGAASRFALTTREPEINAIIAGFNSKQEQLEKICAFIEDSRALAERAETPEELLGGVSEGMDRVVKFLGVSVEKFKTPPEEPGRRMDLLVNHAQSCLDGMRKDMEEVKKITPPADGQLVKLIIRAMADSIEKAASFEKQKERIREQLKLYASGKDLQGLFTYHHPKAIHFEGGKLNVKIEVFRKGDEKMESPVYGLDCDFHERKKLLVDFSSGFLFSTLRDHVYSLGKTDSGSGEGPQAELVRKGGEDAVSAGFGALLHMGRLKLWPGGSATLSFGLATTNTKSSFQYFLGTSFGGGREKKYYLSLGATLSRVRRLKGYAEGDRFEGNSTEIPLEPVYKIGGFLGITFNFLTAKKEESKKGEEK